MSGLRILHLTRHGEVSPPVFEQAGLIVHLAPVGQGANAAVREFGAQAVTVCAPFDTQARAAVEAVSELALPVIGFGLEREDFLTAVASPSIGAQDFVTLIDLALALHSCRFPLGTQSQQEAEESRAMDLVVEIIEQIQTLRIPGYSERSQMIFDTCLWIGNHLCLSPTDLKELLWAARMREIGKLGLPDRILFAQRAQRSTEEQNIHDQYPHLGAKLLQTIPAFRGAAKILMHQLECFDGSGATGLMAQRIPLGSRILRVAAAFYMILADKKGHASTSEVMEILDKGCGSRYDPLLVRLIGNYHALVHDPAGRRDSHGVKVADLVPGMVLAEDVWSRNGMKIMARGTQLSAQTVRLLLQYPLDPSMETVEIRD